MDYETEADLIRQSIYETRENVAEDIAALQLKFKGAVDNVKNIGNKINPVHQATEHPFWAVAGSLAAGALIGTAIGRRSRSHEYGREELFEARQPTGPSFGTRMKERLQHSELKSRFEPEIELVKNMALGAALRGGASLLKKAMPSLSDPVDQVLSSALDRLDQSAEPRPGEPQPRNHRNSEDNERGNRDFSAYG